MKKNRLLILVAYDISDAHSLYRVKKLLKSFAVSGQKSFYECWVTVTELTDLIHAIGERINQSTDRVHFFELDDAHFSIFLGQARRQSFKPFLVT